MLGWSSNIKELVDKYKIKSEQAKSMDMSDVLVLGVNAAKARMQNRIFNQGLDVNENSLGVYRGKKTKAQPDKLKDPDKLKFFTGGVVGLLTPYERKRVENKRQIRYKDLEYSGTLRKGIVTVKETPSRVVASVPSKRNQNIIKGQEQYLGTKIFALSPDEREFMRSNIRAGIKQKYAGLLNS